MSIKIIRRAQTSSAGLLLSLSLVGLAVPQAIQARFSHHEHHLLHHARVGGISGTSGEEYYTNVGGHHVHRPERAASAPSGATARCRDDSWSFSEHHRGTCSHHGGVARWL